MLILKNIVKVIDKISIILVISLYYGSAAIAQSAPTSPASTPENPNTQVPPAAQKIEDRLPQKDVATLKFLVEKYNCNDGSNPDLTFRDGQQIDRIRFAAGLQACIKEIDRLVAQKIDSPVTKEDLETIRRLQESYATELATLKTKVDKVEGKVATVEKQQFSITTKLSGEAVLTAAGASGANPFVAGSGNANIAFTNRVRLNLTTSIPGGGTLITGLQSTNAGSSSSIQSTLGYNDIGGLNSSTVRLGSEVQFPVNPSSGTTVASLTPVANNSTRLYKLLYLQPVNSQLTAFAGTSAEVTDAFPQISPLFNDAQGSLSRFGTTAAVTRVSGGTSGFGLAAAGGVIWQPTTEFDVRALYGNINAFVPGDSLVGGGLFGGSYIFGTQLTYKPSSNLALALNYAFSSHKINILGTGLTSQDINAIPTNAANSLSNRINLNSLGLTANYGITPNIDLTATGSLISSSLPGVDANATFTSWMVGGSFKDAFAPGNMLGILFGQPLNRSSLGGSQAGTNNTNATPYQVETFYNIRVSDNVSITPGVFFVFNPEGIAGTPTATVGALRTTFKF
ncbi:iron uptake porin [Chamaesiphon sp. GL140_3_metabinner_50]|uniref:iron uptake porin n=1 Tax=Chamaesiphon sp. GL140_3_metabinner_50 TaxID=2970812 RepID=UPI0025D52E09|nr:iron uptake porin [Chamaesiphon sp. GL140_3_metabinner_50]